MRKPSLLVIFLTVFIDLVGFGIVLPLLPTYSEEYGAGGFLIGVIIASFSVMQFVFAPAWGKLSDRIGRRPVLLISNFGSVVSYAMFALSAWPGLSARDSVVILLVSRVFAGACGANLSVASAYIADITPPEGRSKGMGLIGAAFGLGFLLGPPLGSFSADRLGLSGPGWVAAALCLVNFLLACVLLVESRQAGSGHAVDRPRLAQWGHVLSQPKVGLLIGLYALSTFCFACYECTLPLLLGSPLFHPDDIKEPRALARKLVLAADPVSQFLQIKLSPGLLLTLARTNESQAALRKLFFKELNQHLGSPSFLPNEVREKITLRAETKELAAQKLSGNALKRLNRLLLEDAFPNEFKRQTLYYDKRSIGYLFMYCGLVSVLVQGGVIGRIVKRFGERRVIFASLAIIAASLLLIPYVETLGWLLVALGLVSLGTGINRAPTMGLISMFASPAEQGATMGVAQSAGTLARIVGPPFATTLYAASPHSPYLAAAVVALLAGALTWRYLLASES
ncbi:MAG: MFS transporter [Verrucomicrobia bacterium]|nr:MFS transporter [Verrucomicrobiota bacterium]